MSVENKLAAVCDALKKADKFDVFKERSKGCSTTEAKLNAAIAILKECGVVESISESGWTLTTTRKPHVKKNNGDPTQHFSETASNPFAAGDKLLCESLGFTPAQDAQSPWSAGPGAGRFV